MSEAEKIYEGSTVVVKATMLQEHTAKLKKVTFKFFQDGEAATTDELCEESEFVKELTVADVGNGTEEDNIEGYDVIVHRVCAPKVPDDKDSYLFNYHLFYEVENGDGKIVKNQDLSPQQYRVFPRTAKLKVTWNEDGEPFHDFKFKVMQNGEQVGGIKHTFSHDTENAKGEIIPAGSVEFNLGLFPGFKLLQHSPWEIVEEIENASKKRECEIKGDLKFKAAFINPQKGDIKQFVNYEPESLGQTGIGHEVVVDVGVDKDDEASQLDLGDKKKEVHFRVSFGPDEGEKVPKSKRNDPDHPTTVRKADEGDTVTITEKEPNKKYEGKVELEAGVGRIKLCLGHAGGDTCKVEIAGSDKFLSDDSVEPDQVLNFENWRRVYYEMMVPDTLYEQALDTRSLDCKPDVRKQLDKLGKQLFIEFNHDSTHVFDAIGQADYGTLGPKRFFDLKDNQSQTAQEDEHETPAYILSGRNWRNPPEGQSWTEANPGKTLCIALCDRIMKWRDDTSDEGAGTKDFSGTLTEAEGSVDAEERFQGQFMPFSGHTDEEGVKDGVSDVIWTADISKDDDVCKYTPELSIEESRYEYPVINQLFVELAAVASYGVRVSVEFSRPDMPLEDDGEVNDEPFDSELTEENSEAIKAFVKALLAEHEVLAKADGKAVVDISCPQGGDSGEDDCIAIVKAKLQELFDEEKEDFYFHPALNADSEFAPRTGECAMAELTDIPKSTLYEWHFRLPEYLADGSIGPGAFVGAEKTKNKCPVKYEFSFRPHLTSKGEADGKLLAWACAEVEADKQLQRLLLSGFNGNSDEGGLEHGHGDEGKPGDCLEEADALCQECHDFGRARNLTTI